MRDDDEGGLGRWTVPTGIAVIITGVLVVIGTLLIRGGAAGLGSEGYPAFGRLLFGGAALLAAAVVLWLAENRLVSWIGWLSILLILAI